MYPLKTNQEHLRSKLGTPTNKKQIYLFHFQAKKKKKRVSVGNWISERNKRFDFFANFWETRGLKISRVRRRGFCKTRFSRRCCREGKFPTYHKLIRHITRSTKYSKLQSTTYCCQVLLSLLRNQRKFVKCHAKTNHTSALVSNDTSSPARVNDDISEPIRL